MNIPFVTRPLSTLRYLAAEYPVYVWSIGLGALGPLMVLIVPPIRKHYFGYKKIPLPPITYPLPKRPRNPPAGYEDEDL
ncbi:hypothetical protein Glove_402g35 [Diversispora epigaea]|uniref:NADH-ubiquinone oxidoreductase 9.5 kDa subunit n=1 Tax=Diversispora epigaea TaxID=1348612 RepID=A0A397GZH4_9GLOM|nr:hypothetical protein Glove_402g35 [Diversispora epigaea]